jgi:hypothetical protein
MKDKEQIAKYWIVLDKEDLSHTNTYSVPMEKKVLELLIAITNQN